MNNRSALHVPCRQPWLKPTPCERISARSLRRMRSGWVGNDRSQKEGRYKEVLGFDPFEDVKLQYCCNYSMFVIEAILAFVLHGKFLRPLPAIFDLFAFAFATSPPKMTRCKDGMTYIVFYIIFYPM